MLFSTKLKLPSVRSHMVNNALTKQTKVNISVFHRLCC